MSPSPRISSPTRSTCTALLATLVLLTGLDARVHSEPVTTKVDTWLGCSRIHFEVDGRACWLTQPKLAAPGKPWVWRARFPGYHPEVDAELVTAGWHVAYINTDGMLGCDTALDHWDAFYTCLTEQFDLAAKPALEGVSRGGLFIYRWAARHPDRVACIHADTPVLDIKSWPLGQGKGIGHDGTWKVLLQHYGLTHEEAIAYDGNPVDNLKPLADARIPLRHVISLTDRVVPPTENTLVLVERYREMGGHIELIEVPVGTEASNGHHFTLPKAFASARFIIRHTQTPLLPKKGTGSDPTQATESNNGLPGGACPLFRHEYFTPRLGLQNSHIRFERAKSGRVAFLGGSITQNSGWRELVCEYLRKRFPETSFDFIHAGISSTGSTPGAFRLTRDVLSNGPVDLLFEEAAVNDPSNGRSPVEMLRAMEGIVRQTRRANPGADVVLMHFVMPPHIDAYRQGQTPEVIVQHERVAEHYGLVSLDLAREVTERIDTGQFTWADDFKGLHPSSYGQQVYAGSMTRMLDALFNETLPENAQPQPHPSPDTLLDAYCYDHAHLVDIGKAKLGDGFQHVESWNPGPGHSTRPGFVDVPALVAETPGAELTFDFDGTAVGIWIAAGRDAGMLTYQIDDGPERTIDSYTRWSRSLHIPWSLLLDTELPPGPHRLTLRIANEKNPASQGNAVRIMHFLVNGVGVGR